MEELSSRKPEIAYIKKDPSISYRTQSNEDGSADGISKVGSSNRLGTLKSRPTDSSNKSKLSRESFHSPSNRIIHASSCRTNRKSREEKQKQVLLDDSDTVESSSKQVRYFGSSEKPLFEKGIDIDGLHAKIDDQLSAAKNEAEKMVPGSKAVACVGIEDIASSSSSSRHKERAVNMGKPEGYATSVVHRSTIGKNTVTGAKPSSNLGSGPHRRGLKNLVCTSISDVLPPGCSAPQVSSNRQDEVVRKRGCDGESSASYRRTNGISGPSNQAVPSGSVDLLPPPPERVAPQQTVRRARIFPSSRDNAVSVRTRRSSTRDMRIRIAEEREGDTFSFPEIVAGVSHLDQPTMYAEGTPERLPRFPVQLEDLYQSYGSQSFTSRSGRSRSRYHMDESPVLMLPGISGERDGYRHATMEGIAEVLLALERIEHDSDLSYEQLMVLEANLFLGGLSLQDQHRDMRLDIDNMSYEELLALEERIGNVSTALPEEQFAKCLEIKIFVPSSVAAAGPSALMADDVKCCICQEEYLEGEEVGKLQCRHQYHVSCIHRWLEQKNWCPICKASAAAS